MVISETDAGGIGRCENVVLRTAYPAMREALSEHLSEFSEKKALESPNGSEIIVDSWPQRVDGEEGRFGFKGVATFYGDTGQS